MGRSGLSLLDLVLLPLTLPYRGLVFIGAKVLEQAERERLDEGAIRARLFDLQARYEAGAVGEAEYRREWEELSALLVALRESREPSGGGEEGCRFLNCGVRRRHLPM